MWLFPLYYFIVYAICCLSTSEESSSASQSIRYSAARKAVDKCAESGNEAPENILRRFYSFNKTDFTTIKQFLMKCYKLFTIFEDKYMIRFPVLFCSLNSVSDCSCMAKW